MSDLAIRVNVRYVAPPKSTISDALQLFRSQHWVQFIINYITPHLNDSTPIPEEVLQDILELQTCPSDGSCVICMEALASKSSKLPCGHEFHAKCVLPWLRIKGTCPSCRHQLKTKEDSVYSIQAINTTIVLQQSQLGLSTPELMSMSASNQTIRAIVNAKVKKNAGNASQEAHQQQLRSGVHEIRSPSRVSNNTSSSSSPTTPRRSRRRRHDDAFTPATINMDHDDTNEQSKKRSRLSTNNRARYTTSL